MLLTILSYRYIFRCRYRSGEEGGKGDGKNEKRELIC